MIRAGLTAAMFGLLMMLMAQSRAGGAERPVDFDRDIRPILSDNCFTCHGPDDSQRLSKLRLDTRDGIFADLGGYHAVIPGHVSNSRLFQRITAPEPLRMPPPYSGRPRLNPQQVETIRRWIEQGAEWSVHWAFLPPQRPETPPVKNAAWPRNPIDHFVLARMEEEGLAPSPEADRRRLIRRVSLDLTGLPPTPAETEAFLADASADAYEKVVDRLLASPRYGERLASWWLDAARYADTNGYQTDAEREMWRWRDWVIEAFNSNLPFDRFTIEQLAGDLLPEPTLEQRIATGFNRNHRANSEGGIIPEEYLVEYAVDRVDTTATIWLGLTAGCARCHDHKYDPIKQKEFYQLTAFFNNVPERGRAYKFGNTPPLIKAPTPAQALRLEELEGKLEKAEKAFEALQGEIEGSQAKWEKAGRSRPPKDWFFEEGLLAHYSFDKENPPFSEDKAARKPGRRGQAAAFDGQNRIVAGDVANFAFLDKFALSAWIYPEDVQAATILSRIGDPAETSGYALVLDKGKVQLNLVNRWLDDALRVESEGEVKAGSWTHVTAVYDATRAATGIQIYLNGVASPIKTNLDELNQSFNSKEPLRIGAVGFPEGGFRGLIDDVRIYSAALKPHEAELIAVPESIPEILAISPAERTPQQARKLRRCFLEQHAPPPVQQAWSALKQARREREQYYETIPTTMVMQEMEPRREAFVLTRGAYDRPAEKVAAGTPAVLHPFPAGHQNDRLGLARWLVDPANPLTARVTVNRLWQMMFGTGLVKTVEDFGSQGERPSHPQLLDWLASDLVSGGWDLKALLRTIVTSATYRQESRVSPELQEKDPENRLLARGTRIRLPAEMIRDQALAFSGLLVEKVGGPSVRPYQPPGLWKELAGGAEYEADTGEGLYRRSLYTFRKRTIPPPALALFDASPRETCVVRENRTNTPLQALNLMNDVTYLEAARVWAEKVMRQERSAPKRIALTFQTATSRPPTSSEMEILGQALEEYLKTYRSDTKAAQELLSLGETPRQDLDPAELAAYTLLASLVLNLDETVTKE